MEATNYENFTAKDFLKDDYFIRWNVQNDESCNAFWKNFLEQHPEKREAVQQAVDLLQVYRSQEEFSNDQQKEVVWNRIENSIQGEAMITPKVIRMPWLQRVVAASVIIAIGLSIYFLVNPNATNTTEASTAFGEIKKITLPDQSVVTLNGNSKISWSGKWDGTAPREVWIDGEAFFEVVHINKDPKQINPGERFIVHSGDVNVEVLGTSFNIRNRHEKTNIGLITGKIQVSSLKETNKATPLIMLPGDYVEYSNNKMLVRKNLEKPAQLTTWTKNRIIFNNAELKDIINVLQDDYGYKVSVKDDRLMNSKIEGEINVANVSELLEVVETTLDIQVAQTDKQISFSFK